MNETRKEKLKSLILKLPFGSQLLQLRQKIILRHHARRREIKLRRKVKERKIMLRREEKELIKAYKIILKQSKTKQLLYSCGAQQEKKIQSINEESIKKVLRIKDTIRQSEFSIHMKNKLFFETRLRNLRYYYVRSIENVARFKTFSPLSPEQVTVFEIGTGPALGAAMGMSLIGFKQIITVDIRRAKPKHVQMVYEHYKKFANELRIKRVPKIKEKITAENLEQILLDQLNIDYRAPYDATHTDLSDGSVGYVYANLVLNFISPEILADMIKEAFRILCSSGVMYVNTIYKDHRTILDSELTVYDYLRYTDEEWKKFNSGSYQNRLRTSDYQALFTAAGFEVVWLKKYNITDADRAAFATVKVADEFKNKYTDEELMEKGAEFILRKP